MKRGVSPRLPLPVFPNALMHNTALIEYLSESPTFSKAGRAALRALVQDAGELSIEARQHLFHMGDAADYFYMVRSGSITLYRPSYGGDNKVFRVLEAGDLLAETAMFMEPSHYPLSARAATDATVYRISRDALMSLVRKSPDFSFAMLQGMALRIAQSLNRIDLLTIGNASQRLVSYLMDIYMQQRSPWLELPVAQNVLARQLNIAPETFSRQLSAFRRKGYIGGRHRELVLLDIQALCRDVNLPPPDMHFGSVRSKASLGESLFDCCNYARQTLGSMVA